MAETGIKRPRPKYQVFISSTFADLREEREAVTWGVLAARHIPVGKHFKRRFLGPRA
jgi:hypothetical protein